MVCRLVGPEDFSLAMRVSYVLYILRYYATREMLRLANLAKLTDAEVAARFDWRDAATIRWSAGDVTEFCP
jgi:hypothetical protein